MEKAEQLYQIVCDGLAKKKLHQQQQQVKQKAACGGARVNYSSSCADNEKPRVKAGTCILKDFGRTAKNPALKWGSNGIGSNFSSALSDSKAAELELEQERLAKAERDKEHALLSASTGLLSLNNRSVHKFEEDQGFIAAEQCSPAQTYYGAVAKST